MGEAIETLAWDSEFFGISIGRAGADTHDFAAVAAEADAKGCDCIYLLLSAADSERVGAAQAEGFRVVDVRVELRAGTVAVTDSQHGCRAADASADADWLKSVASQRFRYSRFYSDHNFPRDAASRMFEAWADRGLTDLGRHVVVLDDHVGFVICGRDTDASEGVIELIATSANAAPGTGQRLMNGGHEWFAAQGLQSASVVTQAANVPALRLYERFGYRVSRSSIWLHRWRPGLADRGGGELGRHFIHS